MRLLEARWAVALGGFSYSLYLIHSPLISLLHIWLRNFDPSPTMRMVALMLFATPLLVLAGYLFHLVFEKPFLPPSRRPAQNADAAGGADAKPPGRDVFAPLAS
jgi:peptidoglycan/LPS O-acetylase OafA/YrhL